MTEIIKFPAKPEWASDVDAKTLDRLIAHGYLQRSQRHNWCAIEAAINQVFYEAVLDAAPELSLQKVLENLLRGFSGKKDDAE